MSKLYILRPKQGINPNPWESWYDKAFGFIVEAQSSKEARALAAENAGDEKETKYDDKYENIISENNPWLNPLQSTCKELKVSGKTGVIMTDFASA